ncbi:hypothetical protein EW146_g2492 [Bondarzewia mesenterica]|uniref:Glycoside hydrolase family 5 domain-containing protein n=1 Tax=Bondarzewia mesenterica TaxID=1095465 RepID=A0A4S4M0X2_9AGAM|nr:hypothetical protein EW146_g2492 [Bondarzewia mesenterica]
MPCRNLARLEENQMRGNSSIPASESCNTLTITKWHADVSQFIRSIDSNHLVCSGNHGFQCPSCPKLFPLNPPAPRPSAAAGASGARRRSVSGVMTKARLMRDIADKRRRVSTASTEVRDGVKIRGRWVASGKSKRQDNGVGSAFDGSQGVDSQDILNIPDIGFGSFQLFPDQNSYGTLGQASDASQSTSVDFDATVQQGIDWIQSQVSVAQAVDKPLALAGFGLVTQFNAPFFVPFNSTLPSIATTPNEGSENSMPNVTDQQRDSAYQQWLQAGIQAGVQGMIHIIPVQNTGDSTGTIGQSPNDGYGTEGVDKKNVLATLANAAQQLIARRVINP